METTGTLIYDGVFKWKGWGGKLGLGKGRCHLWIYDRGDERKKAVAHLRPIVAIVCDLPGNLVSVRAFAGHIATSVAAEFDIDPHRLLWVEYTPGSTYGSNDEHVIEARYEAVEFTWEDRRALSPRWEPLKPPELDTVKAIIGQGLRWE